MTLTADLCDEHGDEARVLDGGFASYGGATSFAGPVTTLSAFEDNSLVREALAEEGGGRVLVVAAGGSTRCAMVAALSSHDTKFSRPPQPYPRLKLESYSQVLKL